MFCSVALKSMESSPVYEKPTIIHHNQLTGGKTFAFSKSRAQLIKEKHAKKAGTKQGERNNLIRGFSLEKLEKWVKKLVKENPSKMSKTTEIANLNDIKVFSIEIQKYIHEACAKMSNLLKMLDLKLKEIKLIDQKIATFATGKAMKKLSKKKISAVKLKAKKLKKAMKKEKVLVQKVMKEIQNKQKKILKVIKTYESKKDKGKGNLNIKNILTSINLKLKSFMHLPYFKDAYQNFIGSVIASSRNLSPKDLKNYHHSSQVLIKKYWKKYLDKAKADYNKKHKKGKKAKKEKK
jgi:hypothetical protein